MKTIFFMVLCLSVQSVKADRKPLTEPQPYQRKAQSIKPIKSEPTGNLGCVIKPVMSDEDLKACKS